jgi:hypothetical protein
MKRCFPRVVWVGVAAAAGLAGCGGTDIRVVNESSYAVTDLVVSTPSDSVVFGALQQGESSDYESVDEAYSAAAATFVASGYRFEIPTPNYAGLEELGGGEFTYHLNIEDFGSGLAYLYATEDL